MEEEEHEVYGQEIPDEGEMDGEMEPHGADVDMAAAEEDAVKVLRSPSVSPISTLTLTLALLGGRCRSWTR